MKFQFKTILFALSLSCSSLLFAQSDASSGANSASSCQLIDPRVFSQNAVDAVLAVLAKDKNKITSDFSAVQQDIQGVLSPKIGIDIMAQFVVPPAIWSAASSSDHQAFNAAFLNFIIGLYSSPLKSFNNQTIEVYPSRVDWTAQKRVQINSVIHNPAAGSAADIPVSFILQKNACSWVFIDFVVDNMSGLANIQAQIQSILKNMKTPALDDLTAVIVKHNASSAS